LGWQRLCSAHEVAIGRLTSVEIQGVKVLVTKVGDVWIDFDHELTYDHGN